MRKRIYKKKKKKTKIIIEIDDNHNNDVITLKGGGREMETVCNNVRPEALSVRCVRIASFKRLNELKKKKTELDLRIAEARHV